MAKAPGLAPQTKTLTKALNELLPGDLDPCTGNKILFIEYSAKDFIVCIDSKIGLNWQTSVEYKAYAEDFGAVIGNCLMSEALIDRMFQVKRDKIKYKQMIAAVLGRLFDDHRSTNAIQLLKVVDERINEHSKEKMRMAYVFYAIWSVFLVCAGIFFLVTLKNFFPTASLDKQTHRLLLSSLLGGLGAFITTFFRFKSYRGSIVAGLPIHRLDGALRIFYGVIAGLLVSLAIKGNVLVGFSNTSAASQPWLGYFLGMVAGASEVLIPNIIKQTEGNLGVKYHTEVTQDVEMKITEKEINLPKLHDKENGRHPKT